MEISPSLLPALINALVTTELYFNHIPEDSVSMAKQGIVEVVKVF